VVLVGEEAMADLHVRWMNEPGPTDVLSFPMDELRRPGDDEEPEPGMLGDVVICPQVAQRQAQAAGHARDDEMALLLTHGILHLIGYDHAEPEEHTEMFGLQARLLAEWVAVR
jgi:probable rRNA maturation factor